MFITLPKGTNPSPHSTSGPLVQLPRTYQAMGSDFGTVVSSVCDNENNGYRLWQREQVEVLISRTHYLKNLIFVGNPKQTATRLAELLLIQSPYAAYMNHIATTLSQTSRPIPAILHPQQLLPYHIRTIDIPPLAESSGYVYVLLARDNSTTYIGQTKDLYHRIQQHNNSLGSTFTSPHHLRPWTCMAFVIGFTTKEKRLNFEQLWQRHAQQHRGPFLSPIQIINLGSLAMSNYADANPNDPVLRMIQCLEFHPV